MKAESYALPILLFIQYPVIGQGVTFKTEYSTVSINNTGFITSIKATPPSREYAPAGMPSPLLSLHKSKVPYFPQSATVGSNRITLNYANGSVATVKVEERPLYLRFELVSLEPRNGVDNIVWGPVKTGISQTIGDIIGVVRDSAFAIGLMGLTDNTTGGLPMDGDLEPMSYIIHSPDPKLYPLPAHLREGQRFTIGGDGINDVAFYSQPEMYYHQVFGNAAVLEPAFGSALTQHSRDRRLPQTIYFTLIPGMKNVPPRHQVVEPTNADYIGSAVALYVSPDTLGLNTIKAIVLAEGLPHPTIDGKWVKDPAAYRPDIAWRGARHDSMIAYAKQLGLKAVQEETHQYYVNPAAPLRGTDVQLAQGKTVPIKELTNLTNAEGIAYGLHTLCNFTQSGTGYVTPIPHDSLCSVLRTSLTQDISATEANITVADTSYLNEFGTWHSPGRNVLKIGKELLTYAGVTRTPPYTLTGIARGAYGTVAGPHRKGDVVTKLQMNAYQGFIPNMTLQQEYALYYANLLRDNGMDYIDFDGFESFVYQGHGYYSFKKFLRALFENYHRLGGKYLRLMGSAVFEGNWHYMSVCNVGGGNHMYNPITDQWGIEGKDIRIGFQSSYFPCTFGIQDLASNWTVQTIETLQAKSIAWDATYMLGLSQDKVEANPEKSKIFKAFRAWENARAANVFSRTLKKEMKAQGSRYHLEEVDGNAWKLFPVLPSGQYGPAVNLARPPVALKAPSKEVAPRGFRFGIRSDVISYQLPGAVRVSLKVYDLKGDCLVTLVDGVQGAGKYTLNGGGKGLGAGRYLYIFKAGSFRSEKVVDILRKSRG